MSEKTPELKFQLKDVKSGRQWTSIKSWQRLNEEIEDLQADRDNMFSRIIRLESRVDALELPLRVKRVLELLEKQDKPRSLRFIQNRISIGYWEFKKHLVATDKVTVSESGTIKMYSVADKKMEAKQG